MTRLVYVDCPDGASGAMLLGALLDAGLPLAQLQGALALMPLDGYTLSAEPLQRGTLGATLVRVDTDHTVQRRYSLSDILGMILGSGLPGAVKDSATRAYTRLAEAEARVRRVSIDAISFHDADAVQMVVEIVGVCAALHLLEIVEVYASPLPVGRGHVETQHGTLPLPVPVTLELLARVSAPAVPHPASLELVTPAAAALLTVLARFAQPSMRPTRIGYGAGASAEPAPNIVRVWLCEGEDAAEGETLLVLEANIDDMAAELFGFAIERLLAAGALDAWCVPLTMKKSRPAVMLSALCRRAARDALMELMLRETSTFGVRVREVTRYAVAREMRTVETPFGPVAVKLKVLDGRIVAAAPEYEDCRRAALAGSVPLSRVYASAVAASAAWLGEPATAAFVEPVAGEQGTAQADGGVC